MKAISVVVSVVMLALPPLAAADTDIAIIVHRKNPLSSLTESDVMRLYLGKTRAFPNQTPARPVSLSNGVSPRREFDARILNRNPNQIRAYWAQQIFTGRGTPPREFGSATDVREFVANHPDAVGFMDAAAVDGSVKVVLRLE